MKLAAPIFGSIFLSLIILMFYWLNWRDSGKQLKVDVAQQLAGLERQWNKSSAIREGKLTLGFNDVVVSGFPFSQRLRLVAPYIRDTRDGYVLTLTMSYLDIIPDVTDDQQPHYQLEYPNDGHAIVNKGVSGAKDVYYLTISPKPRIEARSVANPAAQRTSSLVNQLGIAFAPQLVFTADKTEVSGVSARYNVPVISTQELVWRGIMPNMRERLAYVYRLLPKGAPAP